MREVLDELVAAWRGGATVGLATVVETFRSAPRPPGASMLVRADGTAVGSVSGGCVEGAVYELAGEVVAVDAPVLQRYGVSDDEAHAVGLTCGGVLDVFVEPVSPRHLPELLALADDVEHGRPVALATVVTHPDPARLGRHLLVRPDAVEGSLGHDRVDDAVADDARGLLEAGTSAVLTYGPEGQRRGEGMRVFVAAHAPRPRMLVFGAIDFAAAMARQGAFLGYRVTVCDARPVFATAERFPGADEVVVAWPHRYLAEQVAAGAVDRRTVLCVLTHDPKFDVPLLAAALRRPPGERFAFVGAMGSRRTHDVRREQLLAAGVSAEQLAGLASPIGLDLGARTPEETAVSIAAEIVALRWGGGGERLSTTAGRIHHPGPAAGGAPAPG